MEGLRRAGHPGQRLGRNPRPLGPHVSVAWRRSDHGGPNVRDLQDGSDGCARNAGGGPFDPMAP